MEQNQQAPNTSLFSLNIDGNTNYTLRSAASWAKVLGVVGIIMAVLFFVFAIAFQSSMNRLGGGGYYRDDFSGGNRMFGNIGMIMYIICGIAQLISSLFALNFGNKISKALKTNDQNSLNGGFAAVRNYFALWAILLIITLLFLLIAIASFASRA